MLVVEDDLAMRQMLLAILQEFGIDASGAGGVEEALAALRSRSFQAVLCDLRGLPGEQQSIVRQLLKVQNSSRIILMGPFGMTVSTEQVRKTGAVAYLAKPFDRDKLIDALRAALDDWEYSSA